MRKHMMTSMEACMLQLQLDNPLLVWKLPSFLNQLLFVQLEKGIFHSSILFSIRGCIDSIENWLPLTTSSSWKHSWRQLMTPSIWPTCMVRSLEPLKNLRCKNRWKYTEISSPQLLACCQWQCCYFGWAGSLQMPKILIGDSACLANLLEWVAR